MKVEFESNIFYLRGPSLLLFVAIPEEPSKDIKTISTMVTYGWGVIPVRVRIGETGWKTYLFPKDDRDLVPIRLSVQESENLAVGDHVVILLEV